MSMQVAALAAFGAAHRLVRWFWAGSWEMRSGQYVEEVHVICDSRRIGHHLCPSCLTLITLSDTNEFCYHIYCANALIDHRNSSARTGYPTYKDTLCSLDDLVSPIPISHTISGRAVSR